MEPTINWNLTNQQAQFILDVLSSRPFREVNDLIHELARQSNQPNLMAAEPKQQDDEEKKAKQAA